jgi:hypothetical protein
MKEAKAYRGRIQNPILPRTFDDGENQQSAFFERRVAGSASFAKGE